MSRKVTLSNLKIGDRVKNSFSSTQPKIYRVVNILANREIIFGNKNEVYGFTLIIGGSQSEEYANKYLTLVNRRWPNKYE